MAYIGIRVSEDAKQRLTKRAETLNISLTAYILSKLEDNEVKSTSNDSEELINLLKAELKNKNDQIDDLLKILDQQQQLQLRVQVENTSKSEQLMLVSKELKELKENEIKRHWWQFWK